MNVFCSISAVLGFLLSVLTSSGFNGSISSMKYGYEPGDSSSMAENTDNVTYTYDAFNRLVGSVSSDGYDTSYTYDLNSATTGIVRKGLTSDGVTVGVVDDLTMVYEGNRLTEVSDNADRVTLESSLDFDAQSSTFTYDASGRLTGWSDPLEHTLSYAPNDMPVQMKSGGATVNYRYLADGTKLSRSLTRKILVRPYRKITSTTYDVGSFRFTQSGANGSPVLDRILLPWGYFDKNLQANVYIKDYQGNIRAVYNQDESEIIQQTDYYPYGLPKAKSIAPEINPFKYSGKELYTDLSLTHYDFAARLQLPAIGLFQRPDPKASDFTWLNSYTFCGGDPVNNIDPDGNVVKSLDEESINNILNTLTIKEAEYVRFVNGVLDTNLLNECNSDSENMVALKTLANSDVSYIISTDSEARSKNEVLAFNENGVVGITLMPNAAEYSSPDNNVYIVTDGSLSAEHQVSNVAHEAYGHAYFYELKRQGHNVDPYHRYESVELPSEIDPETGLTVFVFGLVDTNIKLKEQISLVKSQAIQNYKSRKK